jgi:hypothetical protein
VSGLVNVVFIYNSSLKMVALLSNCSTVDQRDVILFCDQKELKRLKLITEFYAHLSVHGEPIFKNVPTRWYFFCTVFCSL